MTVAPRIRKPQAPQVTGLLAPAVSPDDDPGGEKTIKRRIWRGNDFSGSAIASCDIEESTLDAVRFGACEFEKVIVSDSRLERCDLANTRTNSVSVIQCALEGCRLTGSSWTGGFWRDVTVTDCRADLALFRHCKVRAVVFRDCNLIQSDWQWAELHHVRFERCDLSGATFANASTGSTLFADCILDGVAGVSGLKGSSVRGSDLISLGPSLARELGISLAD